MLISRAHKLGFALALLATPLAGYTSPTKATNVAPKDKTQSNFIIPRTSADGRDPFFPKATSLYQVDTQTKAVVVETGVNQLKLNGILGSNLAQINNMTFSVGETYDVKTASGSISVHLIEIHAADETVVIEANGQRRVLSFKTR
jgi:hypothetical protein